jgi:hypothetical protein
MACTAIAIIREKMGKKESPFGILFLMRMLTFTIAVVEMIFSVLKVISNHVCGRELLVAAIVVGISLLLFGVTGKVSDRIRSCEKHV